MQATRLHAVGDLRTTEVPIPDPAPGEIVIRVEAAGICGTDRHLFKGEFPSDPPVTLGHEFSGIVTARGAGVAIPEGARVTCDPNTWCGQCDACLRGRVNLCERNVATGIHRDGGFAEFAVFPARRAITLPADLDPLHGAFCEPLAGADTMLLTRHPAKRALAGRLGVGETAATPEEAFRIWPQGADLTLEC